MMGEYNLGFSPLQLAVGSGALVTGVYYFDNNSLKESIKTGAFVAAGVYVVYSLADAL